MRRSAKTNKDIDENVKSIEAGAKASLVISYLADTLLEVETSILEEAIIRYRQGSLTSEQAKDKVAEIVGLRRLIEHLETMTSKGIQAKREEMKDG